MALDDLLTEKKIFLIVQSVLVFIFILLLLLSLGSGTSSVKKQSSVCGNGVVEPGETSANCCQDVGCSVGFHCVEGENDSFSCQRLDKNETPEFSEIKKLGKTIFSNAYSNGGSDEQVEISKRLLNKDISSLSKKGYDISVEKNASNILYRYIDLLSTLKSLNKEISDLNNNKDFLDVFYVNDSNAGSVKDALVIMKTKSFEGMSDIQSFFIILKGVDGSTRTFLKSSWGVDLDRIVTDLTPLSEEYKDNYKKAESILEGSSND